MAGAHPLVHRAVWSGKSTLAAQCRSARAVVPVEILDGDEVRKHLSNDLGFTKEDRDINVRRIGFVARLLARHGVFVITAAISPYADTRNEIRRLAADEGIPFVEVFVSQPADAGQSRCEGALQAGTRRRDPPLHRRLRSVRSSNDPDAMFTPTTNLWTPARRRC